MKIHNGHTPIFLATGLGHTKIVKLLMEYGATINHIRQIEALLKEDMTDLKQEAKNRALQFASANNFGDITKQLLDNGAQIESLNKAAMANILGGSHVVNRHLVIDHLVSVYSSERIVIENIKELIPTSIMLSSCISYAQSKFAWSSSKVLVMILISIIMNIIIGYTLYFSDVVTDVLFVTNLFHNMERNFTQEFLQCSPNFDSKLAEVYSNCHNNLTGDCLADLAALMKVGQDCINNEDRFDDKTEWLVAGVVTAVHCGLAIMFAIAIWFLMDVRKWSTLPIPLFTWLYKCIIDLKFYKMFRTDPSKITSLHRWNKEKMEIQKELESNQGAINLSIIIEAALESGFQVIFSKENI